MKNAKRIWLAITCIVLAVVMCFSAACSSFQNNHDEINVPGGVEEGLPEEPSAPSGDTELEPSEDGSFGNEDNPSDNPGGGEEVPSIPEEDLFEEYELDDAEGFVYSLLYSDLQQQYDTFAGYISLSDSSEEDVYGIAYTDLSEAYEDNSGKTYFSSGFLSFSGEEEISASLREKGLEIHSLEEDDDLYSYIYTYDTEPVHGHCVVYGKYVQYDIDNVGQITYTEQEYSAGMSVDSSRGNLYSYDEQAYVYIVEEQNYVPVFGVSLLGEADYEQIIAEADRLLKTQEVNFSYSEIESYVSYSMEALNSYLLGLQEETFLGIPTEDLIEIARNLDPLQHLRIEVDESGATTIQLIEVTKLPTFWEKALTSIVCAVAVVGGFVISAVGKTVPGLGALGGALGGALVGAGIEAFSQVVINNTPVSDLQWAQVGVAAISGAISGVIGFKLNTSAAFQGASRVVLKETTDTLCDSLIGGGEFFVNSLIAGYSFEGACKNFGYGMVAGAVISGGVKLATSAVKGVAGLIKKGRQISVTNVNGNELKKISTEAVEECTTNVSSTRASIQAVNGLIAQNSKKINGFVSLNYSSFASNVPNDCLNKNKILFGTINGKGKLIGGHSSDLLLDPDFKFTQILDNEGLPVLNADGTYVITNISYKGAHKSMSTMFPQNWTNEKIIKSINFIGDNCSLGYPDQAGNRLYCAYVDGVQIIVIKDCVGQIVAGYPSGGNLAEKILEQFGLTKV